MRYLGLFLLLSCLFSTGCEWMKKPLPKNPPKEVVSGQPSADSLVSYLNKQADHLAVIQTDDIDVTAFVQKQRMPGLRGFMVCEKPRNFRLTGDAMSTQYVDIGSNGDQFWFWVKDGDPPPLYYCSYSDYEKGVKLPLPFQPEWVVQALGMAKYDPNKQYSVKVNGQSYELIEETTVQGQPVRKITVFAAGQLPDQSYPRVTAHIVQDARTGKVICQATIRRQRIATFRGNGGESSVAYPSDILLEWPAEQLSMRMNIGKATVNVPVSRDEASRLYTMPSWPQKKIDLAQFRPTSNTTAREIRQTGGYR